MFESKLFPDCEMSHVLLILKPPDTEGAIIEPAVRAIIKLVKSLRFILERIDCKIVKPELLAGYSLSISPETENIQ